MKKSTARTTKSTTGTESMPFGEIPTTGQDAEALLKADHRKVEGLFQKYKSLTSAAEKAQCAKEISKELMVHATLEEEIFYPACREKQVESKLLDEAQVEHDGAKVMICELIEQDASEEFYDAKVTVLSEYIKHHVGEEEKRSEGIFAMAKKAGVDMNAVGQKILSRKQELMQSMQDDNLTPPEFRSLQALSNDTYGYKEKTMARNGQRGRYSDDDDDRGYSRGRGRSSERDRDEYGRYMSDDDDDRGGRSGGGRGRGSSSGGSRERDEQGRFMSDDDDRGGRSGGRGRGGSSGGSRERDEQGRFMSDEDDRGYSSDRRSSSRYRDDEDDDGRGRGRGGWFGDSEGHSQAARQGRGSSRRDDDDDRGYSSSRRSSSRYRDEDDDRGYSSSGRGGSYGRSGSSGNRERDESGRFTSDDDRGYSSSRRSSSRYRDDDEDDRSGQGQGWFGDSEGHARAARRGWRNRE